MRTTADIGEFSDRLADFMKQVESGEEVMVTRNEKPVARLIPAAEAFSGPAVRKPIRSFKGHRVLTPVISSADIADEILAPDDRH